MDKLKGLKVAIIASDGVEEKELTEPMDFLIEKGAEIDVIADHPGNIQAFQHHDKSIKVEVSETLDFIDPGSYDALVLPGGALNADTIRMNKEVQAFIQAFMTANKPIAVICHAPWELISAGVVKGRSLTSFETIQDNLKNAGGNWVDEEIVVDGNLITSRKPDDIPRFNEEIEKLFAKK